LGDDPATKQNAKDENAASGEIEPSGSASFRQHRSSINREKQQNGSRMAEWESWRDNSSYNSTSDTGEHRANCSENHLARIGIDCHLTHQDVERENCSGDNNQISPDYCGDAAKSEKKSVQHRPFYLIRTPGIGRFGQPCFRLPTGGSRSFHAAKDSALKANDAVIRVYDEAGNVIETHEHAGDFREQKRC
jgi:hypothetical protein